MFIVGIGGENLDMYEERDDKRRPQVSGLCLKALAGEGVVSVHQHIVLDSTSVHMFFGL